MFPLLTAVGISAATCFLYNRARFSTANFAIRCFRYFAREAAFSPLPPLCFYPMVYSSFLLTKTDDTVLLYHILFIKAKILADFRQKIPWIFIRLFVFWSKNRLSARLLHKNTLYLAENYAIIVIILLNGDIYGYRNFTGT